MSSPACIMQSWKCFFIFIDTEQGAVHNNSVMTVAMICVLLSVSVSVTVSVSVFVRLRVFV